MPVIEPAPAIAPTPPGPCDWPINIVCCPELGTAPILIQETATAWATEILDALTGRRFAQCPLNYRPCGPRCMTGFGYMTWPVGSPQSSGTGGPWMTPFIDAGIWRNCGCSGGCSCKAAQEVPFFTPVAQVVEVRIDGVLLDPSAYRLDIHKGVPVLVRTDGDDWPLCQDMTADVDEVGSFVIVYQPGDLVPLAGQIAAGLLACEFMKACLGQDCALPQQLASMSRNGIEVTVVDPVTLLENGRTGIAQVDLWIKSVNPHSRSQRTRVRSSDLAGPRYS